MMADAICTDIGRYGANQVAVLVVSHADAEDVADRVRAYRGYTGQSRSRQPTHTWNTARVAVVDHGGALADRRGAAQQVADALARQPDPSLAARSDPWVLDRRLRWQIAEHERVLAARPPDRRAALGVATTDLQAAEGRLAHLSSVASGHADNASDRAFAAVTALRLGKGLARPERLVILQPGLTMTSWHMRLALGRRQ